MEIIMPYKVIFIIIFLLSLFVAPQVLLAQENINVYKNYNKYYSFKYDANKVFCYYPPEEDCTMSEDVVILYLDNQ